MLGSVTGELGKHFVGVQPFHKTPFTAVLDQYQEGRRAPEQPSRSEQRVHEANTPLICSEA